MRWWKTTLLVGLLAACGGPNPTAGSLQVVSTLQKDEVALLGEAGLVYDVHVATEDEGELVFEPQLPPDLGADPFRKQVSDRSDGKVHTFRTKLRPTKLGELAIPSFTVKVGERALQTEALTLRVLSTLKESDNETKVEEAAPPFDMPWNLGSLWLWGGIGAGLLVLSGALVWLMRRRRPVAPTLQDNLPCHIVALRALARLRQWPRQTEDEVDAFYVEVSRILRHYLEERFGLHAPERTTEEFLSEIERDESVHLRVEHRTNLRRFLGQCDLVKFARQIPEESVHDGTFQIAEEFIEQTRPDRGRGGDEDQEAAA